MTRARLTGLLTAVLLALAATPAGAAPQRASLPDIEDEVMCPVCGTPLSISQSPQAEREREFIRDLIARGRTKAQIKDALVGQFGEEVLAEPPRRGFDLAVWLVPGALLLAALAALAVTVPRWRRSGRPPGGTGAPPAADEPPLAEADARRLSDDLARYDL